MKWRDIVLENRIITADVICRDMYEETLMVSPWFFNQVVEHLKRNGRIVKYEDSEKCRITYALGVIKFNGNKYILNQAEGDLIDWIQQSEVGEFTYYYDKVVFHTADGMVAAYRDDISNNWKF